MNTEIWSLAAISTTAGHDRAVALLPDKTVVAIDILAESLAPLDVIRRWDHFEPLLKQWSPAGAQVIADAKLVAPLRYPRKLICVGANYRDHRQEMSTSADSRSAEPFFLMKPPSTTIIGPGDDILIRGDADRVDWEAEIAVVIGKRGRDVAPADALYHIAGYMLANDVSARGVHQRENPIHPAFAFDWLGSKGQDTFCPIGPAILPSWFVENPGDIAFSLTVNGVVEQNGTTANLITSILDLVSALTKYVTLEEGDIIATGTPGGVGMAKGRFLVNGDEVGLASPLIGAFSNTVRKIDHKQSRTSN